MELNEYQVRSRETASYGNNLETIDGLTYSVLALCGEAGELANKLKKAHRSGEKPNAAVLGDELGDVLWYVASVAIELGYDLETIAEINLEKLADRKLARQINNHT